MVEVLRVWSGERADLSCERTPIKRFTVSCPIQPLEVENPLTTLVSKALETRAFRIAGDANLGRQGSELIEQPCLMRRM
jgi:hypothetical protein